jgi:hypothetical protein
MVWSIVPGLKHNARGCISCDTSGPAPLCSQKRREVKECEVFSAAGLLNLSAEALSARATE